MGEKQEKIQKAKKEQQKRKNVFNPIYTNPIKNLPTLEASDPFLVPLPSSLESCRLLSQEPVLQKLQEPAENRELSFVVP